MLQIVVYDVYGYCTAMGTRELLGSAWTSQHHLHAMTKWCEPLGWGEKMLWLRSPPKCEVPTLREHLHKFNCGWNMINLFCCVGVWGCNLFVHQVGLWNLKGHAVFIGIGYYLTYHSSSFLSNKHYIESYSWFDAQILISNADVLHQVPPASTGSTNISGLNCSWPSGNRCRYSFGCSNVAKGAWAQKQIWADTAQFRLRGCRSNPGVGHLRACHIRIQAYVIYIIPWYTYHV